MKKIVIIIAGILVAAAAVVGGVCVLGGGKFSLDDKYYGKSEFVNIDTAELSTLIDEKKSFALLIWQPGCQASTDFEKIVKGFSEERQVTFLRMEFSDAKSSGLVGDLKYYPSVALYRDGKLATFLKSDSDEDLSALISEEGFREWWEKYIVEE